MISNLKNKDFSEIKSIRIKYRVFMKNCSVCRAMNSCIFYNVHFLLFGVFCENLKMHLSSYH